jgi:hypothetical protein
VRNKLALLAILAALISGYFVGHSFLDDSDTGISSDLLAKMKYSVTKDFKDPGSAQFRNIEPGGGALIYGEVNAKNGFGAYVGFKPFTYNSAMDASLTGEIGSDVERKSKFKDINTKISVEN